MTLRAVAFSGVDLQRYADAAREAKKGAGGWITRGARDRKAALLEDRSHMSPKEARMVSEKRCPNCYEQLPDAVAVTATGVLVCDGQCALGWMNGERHLKFLAMVGDLKTLLS